MKESRISAALTPILADLGLDLDGIEILPAGKRRLLRVVIDGDGPDGRGPDMDQIAAATRAISATLDDSDAVGAAPYTLEVSSRGVSRPLSEPRHWRRNRGRLVEVSLAGGDTVTGRIVGVDEDRATLDVSGVRRDVDIAGVSRALIQIEFNRPVDAEDVDVGEREEED